MRKKENSGTSETSYSKSVLKTLDILEEYAQHEELGIKELSERTKLPASTVQRIVNTLVTRQFLVQNPSTLKYKLGLTFFHISNNYSDSKNLVKVAKEYMEYQMQRTQETVNLAILQGKNVRYLAKVDSPHILRPSFDVGGAYPAINTALGRCLFAYRPWEKVREILQSENLTDDEIESYKEMLSQAREKGYASEHEEYQPGLACIAAPIWNANGEVVAAISTSIPVIRIDEDKKLIIAEQMKETASEISSHLDS